MNNNFNANNGGRRPWNRQYRGNNRGFGRATRKPSFRGRYVPNDRQNHRRHESYTNRPWKREFPTKRLTEDEIGVTEYINDHKGFNGIIKSRFSDFQVSEINEAGEVAKLTNLSPPEIPKEEAVDEDEDLLLNKYNLEILPMDTWDKINKLILNTKPGGEKVEIDVTGMPKEHRTKIHEAVKKAFGDSVVGSTVTVDDKKFVKFEKYRKGIRIDNRVKWIWPDEYVYFVLYKENCDTMEAASRIAERLKMNIKPSMIGYAGTKDRRAKTSQWVSVRRADPRRVAAAGASLAPLRLGNYRFAPRPLRLGMLRGNRFRICLRNVTASDECVEEACSLLRERGFINYYGLQRFGSRADVPTYLVGLKLLQGNFQEAIDLILQKRDGPMCEVLRVFARAGAAEALRLLTPALARALPAEARLLRALAARPNDLLGALDQVPRNSRLLYLHAQQSLVWNRAASERLRRARCVLLGDLVPAGPGPAEPLDEYEDESDEEEDTATDIAAEANTEENGDQQTELKEEIKDEKSETDEKPKGKRKPKREPKELMNVKVLSQEDVDSGRYSLSDIVLPLPGYKVQYPPNMKQFYEEQLAKDGLKLDMIHKYKSYSLSGGYRAVVVRPTDMSWQAVRYSEPYADLLLSDADELDGRTHTGADENGKYKALLLTMNLPSSCYATMALRELLKVDTSSESQAQQNNYHRQSRPEQTGVEKTGEEKTGEEKTGEEKTGEDKTGEDKTGEEKTGEEKTGGEKTGEDGKTAEVGKKDGAEQNVAEKRKLDSEEDIDSKKVKVDD